MSGFVFGGIKTSSKKYALEMKTFEKVLLSDKSECTAQYDFLPIILVEEVFNSITLTAIEKFLKSCGLTRYKILASINCDVDEKILKKEGKIKFYINNRSSFEDYLEPGCPVLTTGSALYSLLQENDIYPNVVDQRIFGVTDFWFSKDLTSQNCHRIYPIDSIAELTNRGASEPVDSYKTKLARIQIANLIRNGGTPVPRYPKLNKIFIEDKEDFLERFYLPNKDRKNEILAWDTETSGLSFMKDKVGCITLSFDGITGYYIPWRILDEDGKAKLDEILNNNIQLGANLKFDVKMLWRNGIPHARINEDVITIGHTLDETRTNSLKALAFLYSEYGGYERELDKYRDKLNKGRDINYITDIPEELLREYAIMDAIVTRRVYDNILAHMRALDKKHPNEFYPNGLEDYYRKRRIPVENMYSKIEYTGVYVDKEKLDALREEMEEYLTSLRKQLSDSFGLDYDFKWSSSDEVGKFLKKIGWENLGETKNGGYLTGDAQLSRWAKTHPEAKVIQQMRSIATLLQTFVGNQTENSIMAEFLGENDEEGDKGWTQCLVYHPEDDSWRMHPDFKPMRTDSGRSKCNNPNMQQIPTRGKYTKEIKGCLKTPDDNKYYMVTVDYSSLQMRLAAQDAHYSDYLCEVLRRPNADIHSATGFSVFASDKEFDIETITVMQDGKTYEFYGGEEVVTERGEIFARDLTEEDTLVIR